MKPTPHQPRQNPALRGWGTLIVNPANPARDDPRTNPACSPLLGAGDTLGVVAQGNVPGAAGPRAKDPRIRASVAAALAVAPAMREHARRAREDA